MNVAKREIQHFHKFRDCPEVPDLHGFHDFRSVGPIAVDAREAMDATDAVGAVDFANAAGAIRPPCTLQRRARRIRIALIKRAHDVHTSGPRGVHSAPTLAMAASPWALRLTTLSSDIYYDAHNTR